MTDSSSATAKRPASPSPLSDNTAKRAREASSASPTKSDSKKEKMDESSTRERCVLLMLDVRSPVLTSQRQRQRAWPLDGRHHLGPSHLHPRYSCQAF